MNRNIVLLLLFFSSISGCAYIDQNLKVDPQFSIVPSQLGAGTKVSLLVLDERSDQLIGRRANGYGFASAKIETDQDLTEVLRESISKGLVKKGFVPVGKDGSPTFMRVELRVLAYDTAVGLWTAGNIGKSTIKVAATSPAGKTYEKTYHGKKEVRTCFIGSQETNSKVINYAFDAAIENIFKDEELMKFLAAK